MINDENKGPKALFSLIKLLISLTNRKVYCKYSTEWDRKCYNEVVRKEVGTKWIKKKSENLLHIAVKKRICVTN